MQQAVGRWRLALQGSQGIRFKIQEFKISQATNGGWRQAAGSWQLAADGTPKVSGDQIQEFKIS